MALAIMAQPRRTADEPTNGLRESSRDTKMAGGEDADVGKSRRQRSGKSWDRHGIELAEGSRIGDVIADAERDEDDDDQARTAKPEARA